MAEGFFQRHDNVLAYIPNLIGYLRVLCAVYAFAVAQTSPYQMVLAYWFSFVCDELDGRFARMFNQTSTFGAVLDMVTDRLATTGLLALLIIFYPAYYMLFILLIMLDISSHWFQMYSTLALGASTHKDVKSRSALVRFYYSNRTFMGYCCVCCEALYLVLYMARWPQLMQWQVSGLAVALPPVVLQHLPGLATFLPATGLPYVSILGLIALPGVLTKQICNWVQLQNACQSLVDYELKKGKQQ